MREKDEITGLFRSRLAGTEMTVRVVSGRSCGKTWRLPPREDRKRAAFLSPKYYRVAAAASVIFVLGATSAAFWYFPKEEIKEALRRVAVLTPEGSLNGDVVQESFPSIRPATPTAQHSGMKRPASGTPAGLIDQAEDEGESVSVRLSITIRQRVQAGGGYFDNNTVSQAGSPYQNATAQADVASDAFFRCSRGRRTGIRSCKISEIA